MSGRRRSLLLALLLATGSCQPWPADPERSLEQVRASGILRVGVAESPPWIVRRGEEATGVEAELVAAFARELGAEPRWSWGQLESHLEALEHFQLDLVAAGLTARTPWRKRIGTTKPYFVERVLLGAPVDAPVAEERRGLTVAVPSASSLVARVREKGYQPRPVEDLWSDAELAVRAAPAWELRAHDLRPLPGSELERREHVIAVAPGENALLVHLERSLRTNARDLEAALRRSSP